MWLYQTAKDLVTVTYWNHLKAPASFHFDFSFQRWNNNNYWNIWLFCQKSMQEGFFMHEWDVWEMPHGILSMPADVVGGWVGNWVRTGNDRSGDSRFATEERLKFSAFNLINSLSLPQRGMLPGLNCIYQGIAGYYTYSVSIFYTGKRR